MAIHQEICPSCAAPVTVPEDASRIQCPFCDTPLRVERDHGAVALQIGEKLAETVADIGQQTQSAIQEGTAVTRAELRGLQLSQELSNVELRLAQIQSELRTLERVPQNDVTRRQRQDLQAQEAALARQRRALQEALLPPFSRDQEGTDNGDPYQTGAKERSTGGILSSRGKVPLAWLLFSFSGRSSRLAYLAGAVVSFVVWLIVLFIVAAAGEEAPAAVQEPIACMAMPAMVLAFWIYAASAIKRYHDRDKPGWWVLVLLIPLAGAIWQFVELALLPGTPGVNRYG